MPAIICLVAIAFGSGVGAYFMLPGWNWAGFSSVALLILAFGAIKDNHWRLMLGLSLAAAICFGYWRADVRTIQVKAPVLAENMKSVWVTGNVSEIEKTEKGWRVLIANPVIDRLEEAETPLLIRVTFRDKPEAEKGDAMRFLAALFPPSPPVMPGAFDFARHAYYQQLGAVGYALSKPKILGGAQAGDETGLAGKINQARDYIENRLTSLMPPANAAVASAMLIGKQNQVPEAVMQSMQSAGILHIISISGLHMAMVTAFVFIIIRRTLVFIPYAALHMPLKKIASFVALLAAASYLALAGAPVPAERAFIMAALVLLAIMLDRQVQPMRLVAIAAIAVLFLQPESLLSASFQLSFAATTALVAYFDYKRSNSSGGLRFAPLRYLFSIATSSAVASIATMPFCLYHFGNASVSGLFANMLAIPLTSIVTMPAGVIAIITMPLGLDAMPITVLNWSLGWLLIISDSINQHIGLVMHTSPPEWFVLASIAYGGLFFVFVHSRLRLLGLAFAAAVWGLGVWLHTEPLLLVDEQYALVKIDKEKWLLLDRAMPREPVVKDNWVIKQWRQRLHGDFVTANPPLPSGEGRDEGLRHSYIACDVFGCVVDGLAGKVAFPFGMEALADDCKNADVVVSDLELDISCKAVTVSTHRKNYRDFYIVKTNY